MDKYNYQTLIEELSGYSLKDVRCSNRVGKNRIMISFEDETSVLVPEEIWRAFFDGKLKERCGEEHTGYMRVMVITCV